MGVGRSGRTVCHCRRSAAVSYSERRRRLRASPLGAVHTAPAFTPARVGRVTGRKGGRSSVWGPAGGGEALLSCPSMHFACAVGANQGRPLQYRAQLDTCSRRWIVSGAERRSGEQPHTLARRRPATPGAGRVRLSLPRARGELASKVARGQGLGACSAAGPARRSPATFGQKLPSLPPSPPHPTPSRRCPQGSHVWE